MTTIRFYGRAGADLGRQIEHSIPDGGCTVAELRRSLARHHPEAGLLNSGLRACVGDTIVDDDHEVRESDEVEFFPPLSGG